MRQSFWRAKVKKNVVRFLLQNNLLKIISFVFFTIKKNLFSLRVSTVNEGENSSTLRVHIQCKNRHILVRLWYIWKWFFLLSLLSRPPYTVLEQTLLIPN